MDHNPHRVRSGVPRCTPRYVLRAPRSAAGCAALHSYIADPAARPIFLRLTQEFPRVRGHVFGAFRESALLRGRVVDKWRRGARAASRDRHRGGGEGVARECGASLQASSCGFFPDFLLFATQSWL